MTDNIGERMAGLEAGFEGFQKEIVGNNKYVREKLDEITASLPNKVDRPYCQERHEKLADKIGEVEKDGKYEKLEARVRELAEKPSATIQTLVIAIVMSVVGYILGNLP